MISYHIVSCSGFNTQPPEGGCQPEATLEECIERFQHTATRRWLRATTEKSIAEQLMVSTHSHPKVAAAEAKLKAFDGIVSTHSHPKVAAGGLRCIVGIL